MLALMFAACAVALAAVGVQADLDPVLTGRSLAGWKSTYNKKCGSAGQKCCWKRCKTGLKCSEGVCAPPAPPTKPAAPDCTQDECCGDPDCDEGEWCIEGNVCGTKCGMEGTECCNGRDCSGRELVCNVATKACEKKGACGEEGKRCCNGKDCTGRHLACDVEGTKTCKKRPEQPACKASECCGDVDCPKGEWCMKPDYVCEPKCGMEGAKCCNGSDCTGRALVCDAATETCKKRPPPPPKLPACKSGECCGDVDCPKGEWCMKPDYVCEPKCGMEGAKCCNGQDCTGRALVCDKDTEICKKRPPPPPKQPACKLRECCGDVDCPKGKWCMKPDYVCERKCGMEGAKCCNGSDCTGRDLECAPDTEMCVKKRYAGGAEDCTKAECCGDPDCPKGQWCVEGNVCGTKCGMEGSNCCNGSDCTGGELVCDTDADVCVKKGACGLEGNRCCNGSDCVGGELTCDDSKTCVKKPQETACEDAECCGDVDCPKGQWCIKPNYVCAPKCGMDGTECCNGTECVGKGLKCNAHEVCTRKCGGKGEEPCLDGCDKGLWVVKGICSLD